MKITEPYSPDRAREGQVVPVISDGSSIGRTTRQMVCRRVAPSVAAASSASWLKSASTGCMRAHHERKADEGQRHDDAQGV